MPVAQTSVALPRQSYVVPTTTTSVVQNTSLQNTPTPTVRTLPAKIIRKQLPPKYNTVTLPAKVVTSKLPPIGPPPTPQLSSPATAVGSVALPTTVQSVTTSAIPTVVNSIAIPTSAPRISVAPQNIITSVTAPTTTVQSVALPGQIGIGSVRPITTTYATTSARPLTVPLTTASVGYGTGSIRSPIYTTGSVGSQVLRTL